MAFQAALIPVALILGFVVGISPWVDIGINGYDAGLAVVATLPMLALGYVILQLPYEWVRRLERRVRSVFVPLFRNVGLAGIALVSLLAGVGEELLFRGVIQEGLMTWGSDVTGLLLASVIFGLAHFITPAYFWIATGMGLYLGGLYVWTGNLLVPIIVHGLYDFVVLTYYMYRYEPPTKAGGPGATTIGEVERPS